MSSGKTSQPKLTDKKTLNELKSKKLTQRNSDSASPKFKFTETDMQFEYFANPEKLKDPQNIINVATNLDKYEPNIGDTSDNNIESNIDDHLVIDDDKEKSDMKDNDSNNNKMSSEKKNSSSHRNNHKISDKSSEKRDSDRRTKINETSESITIRNIRSDKKVASSRVKSERKDYSDKSDDSISSSKKRKAPKISLNKSAAPKRNETPEEKRKRAYDVYRKLKELEQNHSVKLTKTYYVTDDPDEMQVEFDFQKALRDKRNAVKLYKNFLMNSVYAVEFFNERYDPFDFKLKGWSESMQCSLDDYTEVFEELFEKYKDKGGKMAPEIKLLLMVASSAISFHISKTLCSSISGPGNEKGGQDNFIQSMLSNLMNGGGKQSAPKEVPQNNYTMKPPTDTNAQMEAIRKLQEQRAAQQMQYQAHQNVVKSQQQNNLPMNIPTVNQQINIPNNQNISQMNFNQQKINQTTQLPQNIQQQLNRTNVNNPQILQKIPGQTTQLNPNIFANSQKQIAQNINQQKVNANNSLNSDATSSASLASSSKKSSIKINDVLSPTLEDSDLSNLDLTIKSNNSTQQRSSVTGSAKRKKSTLVFDTSNRNIK
jgi:hypothetical protein